MKVVTVSRGALSIGVAVAFLTACGPFPASQSLPAPSATSSVTHGTKNIGWLYVADDAFSIGIVYIFPYPDTSYGKIKAITRIGYVYGPCADSSGGVWVPAQGRGGPAVLEFVAGTTKRIGRLDLPKKTGVGECAVDGVTGNLAVLGTHSVNIFAQAKGTPTNYSLGDTYVTACAYDDEGNLFVDGMKPISTSQEAFALYELPKGGATLSTITLDKRTGFAGGIQWDGTYVAVATGGNGIRPVVYRLSVSGAKGTVVQAVHPNGLNFEAWFAVAGGKVVGTSGLYAPRIRLWPYPGGGQWIWEMRELEPQGMAIASVP